MRAASASPSVETTRAPGALYEGQVDAPGGPSNPLGRLNAKAGQPAGAGQLTKMVNQICIAGLVQALSEAVNFAQHAGLDVEQVVGARAALGVDHSRQGIQPLSGFLRILVQGGGQHWIVCRHGFSLRWKWRVA